MEGFNINEGFKNTVKEALKDEDFIVAIFDVLLGDETSREKIKKIISLCANRFTLNEMVAVHMTMKYPINERFLGMPGLKDVLPKDISLPGGIASSEKLKEIISQSKDKRKFCKKVLIRTLKKPGMFRCFIHIVKALITQGWVIDDILATPDAIRFMAALIKTAVEVYEEEHATEAALAESFDPDSKKWVSMFVGRFQPFTLGHVKCVKKLRDEFGVPVLICAIPVTEEKSDKEHPFYGELQDKMYENLRDGLNEQFPGLIADVTYVPNAYIGNLVDTAKNLGFQPIGWGCGTDRYEIKTPRKRKKKETDSDYVISGYKPQTDKYIEQQRELDAETQNINPDNFNILHIQRDVTGEGDDPVSKISGTKVREAIMSNDKEAFKRMVPECLYGLFDDFKIALERIYGGEQQTQNTAPEPAYQSIMESKAYRDFKKRLNKGLDELLK